MTPEQRDRLEVERNRLENSYGSGPLADGKVKARIAEIDRQLADAPPLADKPLLVDVINVQAVRDAGMVTHAAAEFLTGLPEDQQVQAILRANPTKEQVAQLAIELIYQARQRDLGVWPYDKA